MTKYELVAKQPKRRVDFCKKIQTKPCVREGNFCEMLLMKNKKYFRGARHARYFYVLRRCKKCM